MTKGARDPSKLIQFLNTSQPTSRRTPAWWTRPGLGWAFGNPDRSDISPSVTACLPLPEQILFPTKHGPSTPPSSKAQWRKNSLLPGKQTEAWKSLHQLCCTGIRKIPIIGAYLLPGLQGLDDLYNYVQSAFNQHQANQHAPVFMGDFIVDLETNNPRDLDRQQQMHARSLKVAG